MCLWLITHRALLVGTWDKGPNVDRRCSTCGQLEINSHCLWECREVAVVCGTTLHLLCHASSSFILTWGHAWWNYLKDDVAKYDNICKAMYRGENGTVRLITDNRAPAVIAQKKNFGDLCTLLTPITIWCIWTTRCTRVFLANKRPPIELIWHTLITTRRAQ